MKTLEANYLSEDKLSQALSAVVADKLNKRGNYNCQQNRDSPFLSRPLIYHTAVRKQSEGRYYRQKVYAIVLCEKQGFLKKI